MQDQSQRSTPASVPETSAHVRAVKSADRVLMVLEHLARQPTSRGLAEISEALGIPRSSLHGLLQTMHHRGWLSVAQNEGQLRYRIGPQALTVGASYLINDDVVHRVTAILDELSDTVAETVHLGVLEDLEVVYLAKRDAPHSLRLVSGVGVRLPAYATALGKVLLAELDDVALEHRLSRPRRQLTGSTLVEPRLLRADIAATRVRGYAIDDEESTVGVRCFAVALGRERPRRYAISCSVPVARLNGREREIVAALVDAVSRVELTEGVNLGS